MAKDPAFLFYTGDFSTGTQFFSDEQVGKFLRILMAQHQHGRLSKNQMLFISKTYDEDVFSKFLIDENGNYFNSRLEFEVNKRKAFSESRSKNKAGKNKIISKSYDIHMENENENKDIIKIENKKVVNIPEFSEFLIYALEKEPTIKENSLKNKYDAWIEAGWKNGHGKKIVNWKSNLLNTLQFIEKTNGTKTTKPTYRNTLVNAFNNSQQANVSDSERELSEDAEYTIIE
jgi:uncharacterized protein YdaU (DUF1376 family)